MKLILYIATNDYMVNSVKIVIILLSLLTTAISAYAYDNNISHKHINYNAAHQSSLSTNNILFNIGFRNGLDSFINTNEKKQTITQWLTDGGYEEDNDAWFLNHFHDPLQPWNNSGLKLPLIPQSDSSITYAQQRIAPYSWQKARIAYYNALSTGNMGEFASTFLALGHLMHLISDIAVPAHVRNDSHPIDPDNFLLGIIPAFLWPKSWLVDSYEKWVAENNDTKINFSGFQVGDNFFDNYVISGADHDLAPIPITALWDTNKYDKDPQTGAFNPIITLQKNIGLSEYTNANFFSQDTIFTNYPHPGQSDTNYTNIDWKNPEMIDAEDGQLDNRIYIYQYLNQSQQLVQSHRLAALGYLSFDCINAGYYDYTDLYLDEKIFEDYAAKLIPRAVGYSAALIDYFFRGTLEISPPTEYVYSIIDGGKSPQRFTLIKAKVRNTSAITAGTGTSIPEATGDGKLVAVAKYRIMPNYSEDLSTYPQSTTDLANAMQNVPFSYSVSKSVTITSSNALKSDAPTEYLFDFSENPIPAGITDLYLQVVFRGTLGSEQNEAIAVGMKDLHEPQHLIFWNDTDYFLFYGTPVKAEDLASDPRVIWYGYIWPFSYNQTFAFSKDYPDPTPAPVITLTDVPPARYSRVILLTDASDAEYYVTDHIFAERPPPPVGNATPSVDATWKDTLPATTVQMDAANNWVMSPVHTLRGIRQHYGVYYMSCYPYQYCVYVNSLPAPPENALGPYPVTNHFLPPTP